MIKINSPDSFLVFETPEEKEIGNLMFKDGKLWFEGDANQCAKMFFDYLELNFNMTAKIVKAQFEKKQKLIDQINAKLSQNLSVEELEDILAYLQNLKG